MRLYVLLLSILFFFSCSDSRKCDCSDDMEFSWKDGISLDNIDVQIPNAVLNVGLPLTFKISTISIPEISNEPIEWNLQSAKLFMDNQVFLENTGLTNFVINSSTIEFPHDLFSSSNGDWVTGPVSIDLTINFPESGALLFITGTIFFYDCEDNNDDFNREECRWPGQIIGDPYYVSPC